MPYGLNRTDRKIILVSGIFFALLVIAALLIVSPESNQEAVPTTYSSDSSGAKAAFLLLQETGHQVERWEESLANLSTGENRILIIAEPDRSANDLERAALRKFIVEGGQVIAIGHIAGLMLPQNSSVAEPLEGLLWGKYPALAPASITRAAPHITMAPKSRWTSESTAVALYGNEQQTVVVNYPYGKGKVIWWASATPLTNAGLKEPGNLAFFLACLGEQERTRILWDEFHHGYGISKRSSDGDLWLAAGALGQLLLFGMAVIWTFSRRHGPIRPSAPETRLSPLEFIETLGGLYEHAHASAVAVDICYQRFLYWLTRNLGIPGNASIEEFEMAVRVRWNFQDDRFAATLLACASARYSPDLSPRRALALIRSLHSYAVRLNLYPLSAKEVH
jgi:hypothetical protein